MAERRDYDKLAPLPDNSKSGRKESEEHKSNQSRKVTKGTVKVRQSLGKRLFRAFILEDAPSVWNYILYDEIIPGIKDALSNAFNMAMYGEVRSSSKSRSRYSSESRVSYDKYYSERDTRSGRDRNRASDRPRGINDCADQEFETLADANEVLQNMFEEVLDHDRVSVADFYDFVGVSDVDYTANRYGWRQEHLEGLKPERVRGGGYILPLPKPVVL